MLKKDLENAFVAHKAGNIEQAYQLYQKVLQTKPDEADALHLLGVVVHQMGMPEKALDYLSQAIAVNKANPIYYNSLGRIMKALGKYCQSIKCYEKSIRLAPRYAEPHYNLGTVFHALQKPGDAIEQYRHAIRINPEFAEACNNLGAALNEIGNFSEARESCLQAIRLKPDYSEAYNNLGNAQKELGDIEPAIRSYRKAIALSGECAETLGNLGNALCEAGRYDEALLSYRRAISMDPTYGKAYNNLGTVLRKLGNLDDAAGCFEKAIERMPNDVEAYHNLGNIFYDRANYEKAISCYHRALAADEHSLDSRINLGICHQENGDSDAAVDMFERIVEENPENAKAYCHLVHEMYKRCQWDRLERMNHKIDRLTAEQLAKGGRPDEMPFLNLIRCSDSSVNGSVAEKWSEQFRSITTQAKKEFSFSHPTGKKDKITIGYLSNNFRNHPTSHLVWRIFENHDRQRFIVHAYSYGDNDNSDYRKRISAGCDRFVDIRGRSHLDAATCIHDDNVDILIDLVGYMRGHRLEIAAHRPSPIQVRWLGLAGTTGADFFDYLITDTIVTPCEEENFYSEKFVYMPDCYQVNSAPVKLAERKMGRNDAGLPEDGFVYCCFCSSYKIDPVVFEIWMAILRNVPGSVLWLLRGNCSVERNLKREAMQHGVEPDRLVFAEKVGKADHLKRIGLADLALDTLIVNGAATTSDALYADVPVLALKGRHFASRMSTSILHGIGLGDLVMETARAYEKKAIEYGNHPLMVWDVRARLRTNKREKPLFDTRRFVRNLEKAYLEMWERYLNGKENRVIYVDAIM